MGGRVPGGAADPPSPTSLRLHEPDADALRSAPNPRFVIGVIDTGVFLENEKPHPFIARHLAADPMEDEIPDEGYLLGRYDGHGTFVAGLIHHEAPGATIHMQNALDRRNGVDESGRDNRVAAQIEALANEPNLKLVNLSFYGEAASDKTEPTPIRNALETLFEYHKDILVITAAGNHGSDQPVWPAKFNENFDQVIAVGALDGSVSPDLQPVKASFSSFWPGIDVYAPGVRMLGPYLSGRYQIPCGEESNTGRCERTYNGWCLWSGTSFAAATVTGRLAATMMEHNLTGREARDKVIPRLFAPVPDIADEQQWRRYLKPYLGPRGLGERQPPPVATDA